MPAPGRTRRRGGISRWLPSGPFFEGPEPAMQVHSARVADRQRRVLVQRLDLPPRTVRRLDPPPAERAGARPPRQIADLRRNGGQGLFVRLRHDRREQAAFGGDRHRDVDLVPPQERILGPAHIAGGQCRERARGCLDHHVVDADAGIGMPGGVDLLAQRDQGIHLAIRAQVEMRDALLGSRQAARDRAPHLRMGDAVVWGTGCEAG